MDPIRRRIVQEIRKHAQHDQSTHGNWASGFAVQRMDPKVSDNDLKKAEAAFAEAVEMLNEFGFELPQQYNRGRAAGRPISTDLNIGVASQGRVTQRAGKNTNAYTAGRSIVMSNRWRPNPGGLARSPAETLIHELGHVVLGDGTASSGLPAPSKYGEQKGELWAESFLALVTGRPVADSVAEELRWKLEHA